MQRTLSTLLLVSFILPLNSKQERQDSGEGHYPRLCCHLVMLLSLVSPSPTHAIECVHRVPYIQCSPASYSSPESPSFLQASARTPACLAPPSRTLLHTHRHVKAHDQRTILTTCPLRAVRLSRSHRQSRRRPTTLCSQNVHYRT